MSSLLDSILKSPGDGEHVPAKQVKAYAWARVSTEMQEEKGLSMPEQLREIRVYAEKHGIEIVAEYQEAASAFQKKSKRVEFERMVEAAKSNREISAILVHDLSRFSRDSVDAQVLLRDLSAAGVRVISLSDPNIDRESVAGVYMEHILLAKNEAYSREIAFHTKKGCRANIQTRDTETGWCYKNGGQPLWGYRSERLQRGEVKRGRPLIKSIWVLDDRIVAGKPVHEWARYCLVELAAKGATLDEIRDFGNGKGIPAPRQEYWGSTTWHSLLHPNSLLQYAGYGVWNVRGKKQRMNPPSEWTVVENAHQALITEDEARRIMEIRSQRQPALPQHSGARARGKGSRYVLSGGLFRCGTCGSNMAGFTSTNGRGRKGDYYVCGSAQYRRSLGCGPGVYLEKNLIEQAVLDGIAQRFEEWSDPDRFTRLVDEALAELHERHTGVSAEIARQLTDTDAKIRNLRSAIEQGYSDVGWANTRLSELNSDRATLASRQAECVCATARPKLDLSAVRAYQRRFSDLLQYATNEEGRRLVRCFVDSVDLRPAVEDTEKANEPATHEITINFKAVPAQFVKGLGAGACFAAMHNALSAYLVRRWVLPRNGRRLGCT